MENFQKTFQNDFFFHFGVYLFQILSHGFLASQLLEIKDKCHAFWHFVYTFRRREEHAKTEEMDLKTLIVNVYLLKG